MTWKSPICLLFVCLTFWCCRNQPAREKPAEGLTHGKADIWVDHSLKPLMETSIHVFHELYPESKFNLQYGSEKEIINQLMHDSFRIAVLGRTLNQQENDAMRALHGVSPKISPIAVDGLALIVHPDNPVSSLTQDQVRKILSGEWHTWQEVDQKGDADSIQIVYDHAGSGLARFVFDSILRANADLIVGRSVTDISQIADVVGRQKHALGIIASSWISDINDANAQKFLEAIRVLYVWNRPQTDSFRPYQASLATKDYPYRRKIHLINAQGYQGLGMGLAGMMTSPRGQKIVLKSGLLPVTMPLRIVRPEN